MSHSPPNRYDPEESNPLLTKHPLNDEWTLWYDNPTQRMSKESWGEQLKEIYTFASVEDFWSLWNNIKGAEDLKIGSNYHLFKKGIAPKWEDPENSRGGKWVIMVKSSQRGTKLNSLWLNSVLAVIGSSLDDCDEICGVVVSIRKQSDKISFWTKNGHKTDVCKRIGQGLKQLLGIEESIGYQLHDDAYKTNRSFGNQNKYEV